MPGVARAAASALVVVFLASFARLLVPFSPDDNRVLTAPGRYLDAALATFLIADGVDKLHDNPRGFYDTAILYPDRAQLRSTEPFLGFALVGLPLRSVLHLGDVDAFEMLRWLMLFAALVYAYLLFRAAGLDVGLSAAGAAICLSQSNLLVEVSRLQVLSIPLMLPILYHAVMIWAGGRPAAAHSIALFFWLALYPLLGMINATVGVVSRAVPPAAAPADVRGAEATRALACLGGAGRCRGRDRCARACSMVVPPRGPEDVRNRCVSRGQELEAGGRTASSRARRVVDRRVGRPRGRCGPGDCGRAEHHPPRAECGGRGNAGASTSEDGSHVALGDSGDVAGDGCRGLVRPEPARSRVARRALRPWMRGGVACVLAGPGPRAPGWRSERHRRTLDAHRRRLGRAAVPGVVRARLRRQPPSAGQRSHQCAPRDRPADEIDPRIRPPLDLRHPLPVDLRHRRDRPGAARARPSRSGHRGRGPDRRGAWRRGTPSARSFSHDRTADGIRRVGGAIARQRRDLRPSVHAMELAVGRDDDRDREGIETPDRQRLSGHHPAVVRLCDRCPAPLPGS